MFLYPLIFSILTGRQRVRKRDVGFGPRTQEDMHAWDTFMTLAATARKFRISFFAYFHDRISSTNQILPMATLIMQWQRAN